MTNFAKTVFVGTQAGKVVFSGFMKAQDYVQFLRGKVITVNPQAQRSLATGANKETTEELIENDRVLKTDRTKKFGKFVHRVMDNVEQNVISDGFLGAISLVLPETFKGARLDDIQAAGISDEARVGVIRANVRMGESIFHIADGQGRIVGFHAMERELVLRIVGLKADIKKIAKRGLPAAKEKEALDELEKALERVHKFLSETDLSFVCYANRLTEDKTIVGLDQNAERRCYIEGNALNSMATKEEMLKYEGFSPVVMDLQIRRSEFDWMSDSHIEEDSKSISASSSKLFTLSALVQAYSWGMVNDNKPMKNLDMKLQAVVDDRKAFCQSFWSEIAKIFEPVWLQDVDGEPGERAAYLKEVKQVQKNVVFQAVFLQALGRLCYAMGKQANWDPSSPLIQRLDQLSPRYIEYRAAKKYHVDDEGAVIVDEWADEWTRAMMKPSTDKKTGELLGYTFNNASENVNAVRRVLAGRLGLQDGSEDTGDLDLGEAEEAQTAA